MNRIDVMLDIETLGTTDEQQVIQISAAAFDSYKWEVIDSYNAHIDISRDKNTVISGSTLKWWMDTDKELLAELLKKGNLSEEEAIIGFARWIKGLSPDIKEVYLWGNGILFDNKIIASKMEKYDIHYPIYYRNDRDFRTVVDLASTKLGMTYSAFLDMAAPRGLVKHDAYNDVLSQIEILKEAYKTLMEE